MALKRLERFEQPERLELASVEIDGAIYTISICLINTLHWATQDLRLQESQRATK
jgi:hypothetical protein